MSASPPTSRGRETRERIVQAAAMLVVEQGAAATSLDDVRRATQASKSQLYHYFGDKHGLVDAVLEHFCEAVVGGQEQALDGVADWPGLERWADALVAAARARAGRIGCPIGTLTGEMADTDEQARGKLSAAMERWDAALRGALGRMRDAGALRADANVDAFATSTLAAVQGGLLLTKATRDAERLRVALDAALAHLRTAAV